MSTNNAGVKITLNIEDFLAHVASEEDFAAIVSAVVKRAEEYNINPEKWLLPATLKAFHQVSGDEYEPMKLVMAAYIEEHGLAKAAHFALREIAKAYESAAVNGGYQ